jgi:hypothetical protein
MILTEKHKTQIASKSNMNYESIHVDTLKSIVGPRNHNQPFTGRNTKILDESSNQRQNSNHIDMSKFMRGSSTKYKSFESSNAKILYRILQQKNHNCIVIPKSTTESQHKF